jgi:hypothetical protein
MNLMRLDTDALRSIAWGNEIDHPVVYSDLWRHINRTQLGEIRILHIPKLKVGKGEL